MITGNTTALVTDTSLAIGTAFTRELLKRGARKIYVAAPNGAAPADDPRIEIVALDLAKPRDIQAVIGSAGDVDMVINTTGFSHPHPLFESGLDHLTRPHFDAGFYGVLRLCRALAPTLEKNGGGVIINVLAIGSWMNWGGIAAYSALQAAAWSLTQGLRDELAEYDVRLLTLHLGITRNAEAVAAKALDAFENGVEEAWSDGLKPAFA